MDKQSQSDHKTLAFHRESHPNPKPDLEDLVFLSDASLKLFETLDLDQTLENITKVFVPYLAQCSALYLYGKDGHLKLENVVHENSQMLELVWDFDRRFQPGANSDTDLVTSYREKSPLSCQLPTTPSGLSALSKKPVINLSEHLDLNAFAYVPFGSDSGCSGVIVVARKGRPYSSDDLALFSNLERHISLALKNAEAARNSKNQYSELINGLDAIVWESDLDRRHYHYISQPTEALIGYSVARWLHEEGVWEAIIHPLDKNFVVKTYRDHVEHGEGFNYEYRIITADGQIKWIRDLFSTVTNSEGTPCKVRGIILDVTEAHRTSEALQKSESALSIFAETVSDYAVILLDPNGIITSWNTGAEKITQFSSDEAIGQPITIIFTPEDRERGAAEMEQQVALSGRSAEDNRWHVRKNGSRFWAMGAFTALRDERGELLGFVKLARDMTDQKNKEEELQRAKEAAEVANEAKGQFLAIMSHELRTPLGAMIGFADALLDKELMEDKRMEYAETIRSSGQKLSTLINDILDLSKVEAGRLEIERHDFPVGEIFHEIDSLLGNRAKEKNLQLTFKVENEIPASIRSDPSRLRQILINIIGNAIKFTSQGSIDVSIRYVKEKPVEDSKLCVVVNDTGPGIPEDMQSQLFQPFIQADNSISRRFGGTGLGLALSRRLARALGGDIRLMYSQVGKGSCFEISIHVGDVTQIPMIKSLKGPTRQGPPRSSIPSNRPLFGMRVLVVDDAPENRLLISHILKRGGSLDVHTVEHGGLAIAETEKNDYDVVIMDMQMPVMDGFEATATLRRKG